MSIKLRPWQQEAHDKSLKWWANEENNKNFVINAAPGSGKTLCASFIAKSLIDLKQIDQVVVIAPRSEVVKQWSRDFKKVTGRYMEKVTESQLSYTENSTDVAATWAALEGLKQFLSEICIKRRVLVICDEHHHAAEDASWGLNADSSFSKSKYTLILTGTPVRSDGKDSVWIETGGKNKKMLHPEKGTYTLTYGEAIDLGYCRPATFHRHEGKYKVSLADGKETVITSRSDKVNLPHDFPEIKALQKALNFYSLACKPQYDVDGMTPNLKGFQSSMINHAIKKLDDIRHRLPNAGGLVIAPSIEMAEYMSKILEIIEGEKPIIVHSQMTNSEYKIDRFRDSEKRWIVSVNMISEGVDIKRLRVLVYLPNSQTELSFRQALGRVVRTNGPDDDSCAYVVMPILKTFDDYASRVENEMPPRYKKPEKITRKKCPTCSEECELDQETCHNCGHVFEIRKKPFNDYQICGSCGEKNSLDSTICKSCGKSLEPEFDISLSEALRDGAISRGIHLSEDEVQTGEELSEKTRDLILKSGDEKLIELIRKIPPESAGRLYKIFNQTQTH